MKLDRRTLLKALGCEAASGLLSAASREGWSLDAHENSPTRIAHDPLRPEYHLLPPHNWMNDPNGPIWWKGKYHLFYQLNPHAAVWGDMHWGHAVSTDMVRWRHQPIALAPTLGGPDSEGCFSGSAVVMDGVPTFIYTGVQNAPPDLVTLRDGNDKLRETQLLATADDDDLLHWKKLDRPIIATPPPGIVVSGFRDPCLWRESGTWYLGLGSGERGKGGCVLLYRSQDLRNWTYLNKLCEGTPNGRVAANPCDTGEMWECPDFFTLNGRHCLFYSTEDKVIWTTGEYDSKAHRYIPKRDGVLDRGAYYAPKSFLAPDGRRILWGWIRETRPEAEFAAAGWAGAMSLPRVLTTDSQGQLEMNPAEEVKTLRGPLERISVTSATPHRSKLTVLRHELEVPMDTSAKTVTVRLLDSSAPVWELLLDLTASVIHCGAISFPVPSLPWPHRSMRIFLDGSVIESFICGREAITSRVYSLKPNHAELELSLTGDTGLEVSLWALKPISPDRMTT